MRCEEELNFFAFFLDPPVNRRTDFIKICINIKIGKPYNLNTLSVDIFRSDGIPICFFFFIMTAAVKFNRKRRLAAIKIHYVIADYFLPLKTGSVFIQEFIPEFVFPGRGVFAEISCFFNKISVVF